MRDLEMLSTCGGSNMKKFVSRRAVFLATLLVMAVVMVGVATSANAAPCGFYTVGTFIVEAHYNHCAASGNVVIRVDTGGAQSYTMCVRPGTTFLGRVNAYPFVGNAYYIGRQC